MARYRVVVTWTLFQRPHGKSVPEIVNAWSWQSRFAPQPDFAREPPKQPADCVIAEWPSRLGDEERIDISE